MVELFFLFVKKAKEDFRYCGELDCWEFVDNLITFCRNFCAVDQIEHEQWSFDIFNY